MKNDNLTGRIVYVTWYEIEDELDWYLYRILDRDDALRLLLLEGIPEKGMPFGPPFWVCIESIVAMEIIDYEEELTVLESKLLLTNELEEKKNIIDNSGDFIKMRETAQRLYEEVDNLSKVILNIKSNNKIKNLEKTLENSISLTDIDSDSTDSEENEFFLDEDSDEEEWKKGQNQ